jgi:uncharacterized protein
LGARRVLPRGAAALYSGATDTYDARAMKTSPDERLPYRELARQGARLVRSVPAGELARLAAVAPGVGMLDVDLAFRSDDEARVWVSGMVQTRVLATCQRCLGEFEHPLRATFELCLAADEDEASALAEQADVVVAVQDVVTVAELVEDELILGVPERLCSVDPCEHAPPLLGSESGDEQVARRNPFEILSVLKS